MPFEKQGIRFVGRTQRLGDALELERSFVRIEYQRSDSSLRLLWRDLMQIGRIMPTKYMGKKGIIAYIACHERETEKAELRLAA